MKVALARGDPVEVFNENGEVVAVPVELRGAWDPQLNWNGSYLGIDTEQGVGVWDGSSFELLAGDLYPVEGFVARGLAGNVNREGNPPVQPVLRVGQTQGRAVSPTGDVAFYAAFLDDLETVLPEVWTDYYGLASGTGSFNEFAYSQAISERNLALPIWSQDGFALLADKIGGDELEHWGWLLQDGTEQSVWAEGAAAPDSDGLLLTGRGTVLDYLLDRTLLASLEASPDGGFTNAEQLVYLIQPDGTQHFLWKGIAQPYDDIEGGSGVFSASLGGTLIDSGATYLNAHGDVATLAALSPEGAGTKLALLQKPFGGDLEYVVGVGDELPTAENVSLGTVDRIRDWRIAENGDVLFMADLDEAPGTWVFRKERETGHFSHIGPAYDEAIAGKEGFTATTMRLLNMNASGRVALEITGQSDSEGTASGVFLQSEQGGFAPVIWDQIARIGAEDVLVSSYQDTQLSELNTLSITSNLSVGTSVIVARIAGEVDPIGNRFIWEGGAGTNDWHTVTNGRSNWVDTAGTPWPYPPTAGSIVEISLDVQVQLTAPSSIGSLEVQRGTLRIESDLSFADTMTVGPDAKLSMRSGLIESDAGTGVIKGGFFKVGEETATVNVSVFKLQGPSFIMENGELFFANIETWFGAQEYSQIGGTVWVGGTLSRLQGEEFHLQVSSGQFTLTSREIRLETDTTLETIDTSAQILFGRELFAQSEIDEYTPVSFLGGSEQAKRSFTLTGEGTIKLLAPFIITESESLLLDVGDGYGDNGVLIDIPQIPGNDFSRVVEVTGSTAVNSGLLTLVNGGITGTVVAAEEGGSNYLGLQNQGRLVIGTASSHPTLTFGGLNFAVIEQRADFLHENIRNLSGSSYVSFGGVTSPAGFGSAIRFESSALLTAKSGETLLNTVGPLGTFAGFINDGRLQVSSGASLALHGFSFSGLGRANVQQEGTLALQSFSVENLETTGPGTTHLSGEITLSRQGTESLTALLNGTDRAAMIAATEKVIVEGAEIGNPSGFLRVQWGKPPELENTPAVDPDLELLTYAVEIDGLKSPANLVLDCVASTAATGLDVNGLSRFDRLKLESGVDFSERQSAILEAELEANTLVVDAPGETVTILPSLNILSSSLVTVRSGTTLQIASTNAYNRDSKTLLTGSWFLRGSLYFLNFAEERINSPLLAIASPATLLLAKDGDNAEITPGFPSRNDPLLVEGTLVLEDVIMEMNENLLSIDGGRLQVQPPSEIRGSLRAVSPQIEDAIPLARLEGHLNITGDVEVNGIVGVGASPGQWSIGGDLLLGENSEVHLEIGGPEPNTGYDLITVGGQIQMAGSLRFSTYGDYAFSGSETFAFISASDAVGSFASIDQTELGRDYRLELAFSETGLTASTLAQTIQSYSAWRSLYFTAEEVADESLSGQQSDPDQDQRSNLEEYLFGGNPFAAENALLQFNPYIDQQHSTLSFEWGTDINDFQWRFEKSIDLLDWQILPVDTETQAQGDGLTRYTLRFNEELPPDSAKFYRIAVSATE